MKTMFVRCVIILQMFNFSPETIIWKKCRVPTVLTVPMSQCAIVLVRSGLTKHARVDLSALDLQRKTGQTRGVLLSAPWRGLGYPLQEEELPACEWINVWNICDYVCIAEKPMLLNNLYLEKKFSFCRQKEKSRYKFNNSEKVLKQPEKNPFFPLYLNWSMAKQGTKLLLPLLSKKAFLFKKNIFPSEDTGLCVGPLHLGCPADATGSGGSNDDDDDDGAASLATVGFGVLSLLVAVETLLCWAQAAFSYSRFNLQMSSFRGVQ